ncbi:protein RESPONSE TO LOW SULFUR 4 [Amborella trichopoda]|uniref:Uncharacterized protein n=1 Tax=Amborella trichopoda TaxID=13333 RepID=W1PKF8_AMBTC|nr:protein RESPONSE TO LOW SULFUR 4 [Amborella trichopoda]ERN08194.1 hypothetical protein AMTR_s00018p00181440 [Amborella trichopoda]|eukprot:XP_006846519.1 protein RESPONSE TO LOW SULFUR 4 [Amborella trichopoda]
MAPAAAVRFSGKGEEEGLKKTNEELQRELWASLEREERMREQLERVIRQLRLLEDAEERLCTQLGEVEAEALDQARTYNMQVQALTLRLSQAEALLQKTLCSQALSL